jgi:hypothetical protein
LYHVVIQNKEPHLRPYQVLQHLHSMGNTFHSTIVLLRKYESRNTAMCVENRHSLERDKAAFIQYIVMSDLPFADPQD